MYLDAMPISLRTANNVALFHRRIHRERMNGGSFRAGLVGLRGISREIGDWDIQGLDLEILRRGIPHDEPIRAAAAHRVPLG
jgi:hypothetical protein